MERFELTVEQARAIVTAVTAVPGVAGLAGGRFGEVALLFPGERILGVRRPNPRTDAHLQVNLSLDLGVPLAELRPLDEIASDVRAAVTAACPQVTQLDLVWADADDAPASAPDGDAPNS